MKTEHILIIRFSAMGDVAMLVPVVASLAQQYPHIRITVLSQPFARKFFDELAENVGFMAADIRKEYKGIHGLNKLYRRLIAKHFTHVADMHDVLRSKYLRLRFNIDRYRIEHIDKHRAEKRKLVAKTGKRLVQLSSSFENYADVLQRLGYPVELRFHSLFGESKGNLRLILSAIGEKKVFQKWVGIAPFAAHEGKIYPVYKTNKVIELLTKSHLNWRFFLFGGGKAEKAQFDEWETKYPQCINASARLNGLGEELILMSHLDVMLSMDSANMHLASMVGTRVISIWGATHPFAGFMGWNQREEDTIQVSLPCRPCSIYGNKPCQRKDFACMQQIEPEVVVKQIETIAE